MHKGVGFCFVLFCFVLCLMGAQVFVYCYGHVLLLFFGRGGGGGWIGVGAIMGVKNGGGDGDVAFVVLSNLFYTC